VPCYFDQLRSAPVVQRSALRTGRCCCWHSQIGKCSKDGSNRDAPRLCAKGFCGTCCQPHCSEKAHGNRGAARGCPGKPEALKWHFALGEAIKFVKECMQHPGAAKFMGIENIARHTVFDAIFKMMVQEFRKTPPSCSLDPEHLPLKDQLATLSCILHPKRTQHRISFLKKILK
jgi:hypothetical protein